MKDEERNERTPPQFLGECMWYGVWTGNHSVGTLQPVWEDAWFRRAQWPSVLRETMSAHSSRGVFKWSEDPNWIFVRMGPAHPYEVWSGRDLPRWGVLPDMDVPGGDIYTPPLPEGEGGIKESWDCPMTNPNLNYSHGMECHDTPGWQTHDCDLPKKSCVGVNGSPEWCLMGRFVLFCFGVVV